MSIAPPDTFFSHTQPYLGAKYLRTCPAPAHFGRRRSPPFKKRPRRAILGPGGGGTRSCERLGNCSFCDFGQFLPKKGDFCRSGDAGGVLVRVTPFPKMPPFPN